MTYTNIKCFSWMFHIYTKNLIFSKIMIIFTIRQQYESNGSSFIKFQVESCIAEFFELEWYYVVYCSFWVDFGHKLKSEPTNGIVDCSIRKDLNVYH